MHIALGSTAGLTAGFVSWILRGGALIASMLSSVPLLNRFDPLPILRTQEQNRNTYSGDDNEHTELQNESKVNKLFDQQQSPGREG